MKKLNVKKFETLFQERRAKLLASDKAEVQTEGGDTTDRVQDFVLNEMLDRMTARDKVALHRLEMALKRITAGTFGICEECEEEIPEKRLEIVPDCNVCVVCAEKQEKLAKQFGR